jgi:type II secretory pathway component PulK
MRHRRDRGIVLLLVLLVLTILIVLVGQIVLATAHSRTVADNAVHDLQNSYGIKSGYEVALEYLGADSEKAPDVDSLDEKWASPVSVTVGKASATAKIEDCERKINLAMMVNDKGEANPRIVDQLKRLLRQFGHDETIADRILDYQDADAKGDYEENARNERLLGLDELQRIDGIKREVLVGDDSHKAILPFLTVWPRVQGTGAAAMAVGGVNLNTASVEVLESLDDGMTAQIAAAIAARRSQKSGDGTTQTFKSVNDLHDIDGMTDKLFQALQSQVVVKASAFEIHVRSAVGTVEKKWVYVVSRAITPAGPGGGAPSVKTELIAAQREIELVSLKPIKED